MDDLIRKGACDIVALLQAGEISTDDTLDALAARIEAVEPEINALPTLCFERARERGRAGDFKSSLLAGIPIAIKDLTDVAGVRTTYGSMLHEKHVPENSDLLVERLEKNGGVVYAKSNTPEFGSGGNSFNDVFGVTRNPHDTTRSAGGSSGGAAAALASGTAWLAQGSDLGGSLRTPAAFCGVTSLRPSPGVVTTNSGLSPFNVYSQKGPMARNIADLALFADALAGPSALVGVSKPHGIDDFRNAAAKPVKPLKIAYSEDLGVTRTSAEVSEVCNRAMEKLGAEKIAIENTHPDLGMMDAAFDVPRALDYAMSYGADLDEIRDIIKPENIWNIEFGLQLGADEIRRSLEVQGQVFNNAAQFMRQFDLLVCPATIVPAYPVEERYPGFSEGVPYAEYYRWLAICCAITTTTLPVITLPCGKTGAGLPVGLQIIGKPHGDLELFAFASFLERVFGWDGGQLLV
ncbi:MAG: amidase [Gammaproteobacteria bacterium]|nr:amidase [Gammaproteobacteria bacterium]